MKVEFMSLRAKNKEMESEYKVLQSKHRYLDYSLVYFKINKCICSDALDAEQEMQVEKDQYELKVIFITSNIAFQVFVDQIPGGRFECSPDSAFQ